MVDKREIDARIIKWVTYLVDNKQLKSEAAFLKKVGLTLNKISDARKNKASFTASDIGIILMNYEELNARWIMTGEGDMLLSQENQSQDSVLKRISQLEDAVDALKKANAQQDLDAECVAVSV